MIVAIWVNCEARSAVLRSSALVKSYTSEEERMISFERTKTNHDKLPRENNASNYIPHNLHKLSSCVFFFFFRRIWNSQRSLWRNNQAIYFYWIEAGLFYKRCSVIREDAAVCFAIYYFCFHSSGSCHATWFSLAIRRRFIKRILLSLLQYSPKIMHAQELLFASARRSSSCGWLRVAWTWVLETARTSLRLYDKSARTSLR